MSGWLDKAISRVEASLSLAEKKINDQELETLLARRKALMLEFNVLTDSSAYAQLLSMIDNPRDMQVILDREATLESSSLNALRKSIDKFSESLAYFKMVLREIETRNRFQELKQ